MRQRRLGACGPVTGAIGFGAMGLSGAYGSASDEEGLTTLRKAMDLGVILIDTADIYGEGRNERLVGRAIAGRRDTVVLATKFGGGFHEDGSSAGQGRPDLVRPALEASLSRLAVDYVDLYYLHRVDPTTPIEDTVGAMADLVAAGLVRFIGTVPRFQGTGLEAMVSLSEKFRAIAAELALRPAQLALAWLLCQGPDIVPIPGTRSAGNLEANAQAADIRLDAATVARLGRLFPIRAVAADRYPPGSMERINL
jgi:aryl-alcohol dehydrogenase-like predicted oxidoreductase